MFSGLPALSRVTRSLLTRNGYSHPIAGAIELIAQARLAPEARLGQPLHPDLDGKEAAGLRLRCPRHRA